MNKKYVLALSLVLFCFVAVAFADDLPWEKKLPFKHATIQYDLSGNEHGKETLYIKDYGKLRAKYHKATATIMGMTNKTETLEITDPDWISTYNLTDKTGSKITNPYKLYQAEYSKLSRTEKRNFEKNSKELGASMLGKFGGSVKPSSAQILGYDCDVTTVTGMSTTYTLHGTDIPLRSEISAMGMNSSTTATQIDTATAIPDNTFSPPVGISALENQEMETMSRDSIMQVIDTLKEPDGAQKMQNFTPAMGSGGMQERMEADGMSPDEQQEMMRQMEEAMKQMQKRRPQQ